MRRDEFHTIALAELDALYRFARFLTRDPHDAEELVQDVYARAFREQSIESFTSRDGGMRAWLMTIARNQFYVTKEREKSRRRTLQGLAMQQTHAAHEETEPLNASVLAGIDWDHVGPALRDAIDHLTAELRDVLWCWGVEGMKYREIAAALDVPIGTVMSRLHRARTSVAGALVATHAGAIPDAVIARRASPSSHARPGGAP